MRGATDHNFIERRTTGVSIHAPVRGATSYVLPTISNCLGFNPRARVGRDIKPATCGEAGRSFNPRARVGRDIPLHVLLAFLQRFNPRARVGRDGEERQYAIGLSVFQSTRPRGARQDEEKGEKAWK